MGVFSKLWSAFTGRNRKQESDLYANYDKVDTVVTELNSIATKTVMNASDEVCDAMRAINKVKGMEQYVGTITVSNFETAFDGISDSIKSLALQLQEKAEEIKRYETAEWYEKVGSTFTMGLAKIGEGLLTPFEEAGDAVVGVVGWLAPKDSELEHSCTEFIKKDWAHDVLNFYYNSEFADKSAITEDGIAANSLVVFGKTVSLLAVIPITGPVVALGLSGVGSGTETGIKNGKDVNSALWEDGLAGGLAQLLPGMLGGQAGILAGAAFNQYRNAKATENAEKMATALEIIDAVPATDIFTSVTEPPTTGGGSGKTEPDTVPTTQSTKTSPPTSPSGEEQKEESKKSPSDETGERTFRSEIVDTVDFKNKEIATEPEIKIGTEVPTVRPTEPVTHYEPNTIPPTVAPTISKAPVESQTSEGAREPIGYPNTNNGGGNSFTGGGEYGDNGFKPDETEELEVLDDSLIDGTTSISDILDGKSITKVKSNAPISGKSRATGSSSKVIPIAAGLTAAAAAGIGAKAYLDSRDRDEEDDEYDDEEFEEVDWSNEQALSEQSYEQQEKETINTSEEFELDEDNYYAEDNDEYNAGDEELVELQ